MTVKAKCKTCVKVTPHLHITRSHCVCTICGAGRNKPCHCGSGRKYKHCCLDRNYAPVRNQVIAASKQNAKAQEPRK